MGVTREDLQDFNRFADQRLENGGADSLVELVCKWEAQRRGLPRSDLVLDEKTISLLAASFPDVHNASQLLQAIARRDGVTTADLLSNAAQVERS